MVASMPVDAVFCDKSGHEFNEFVPVDFVLGPYVRDLQATADAHCSAPNAEGKTMFTNVHSHFLCILRASTLLLLGLQASSNRSSLGDERASSGQSVTEPFKAAAGK